jgi:hypothetical protein
MMPVPPFADADEARLFVRQLAVHIASLDGGQVALSTFVLLSVLEGTHNFHRGLPVSASETRLPASVLHIALLSRFPVAWTPQGLHAATRAGDDWATAIPSTETEFSEGTDPVITATRAADGRWTVTQTERGSTTVLHAGLDDDAYVQVLLDDRRGHPYPYGWKSDDLPGFADAVRSGITACDDWDAGHGRLPYLTNWIAERDAAATG